MSKLFNLFSSSRHNSAGVEDGRVKNVDEDTSDGVWERRRISVSHSGRWKSQHKQRLSLRADTYQTPVTVGATAASAPPHGQYFRYTALGNLPNVGPATTVATTAPVTTSSGSSAAGQDKAGQEEVIITAM